MEERSKFSSSNKENDPSLMSEPFVKLHDDEEAGHRFCIKENLKPSRLPRPHTRPELIKKNSPSLNKDIPLSLRSKRSRFSKIMVMEERSKFSSSNRENDPSLMSEPFVKLHDDEEAGHRFCIKENLKPSRLPRPHRRPELIKKNSPSLNKDIPLSLRSKRSRFSKIKVMEERSKFSSSNKENDPSLMSEPFVKLHDDEEAGHRFCIKENLKPSRIPRPHRRPELIKKNSPSLNKDIPLSLRSKRSRFSKIKVMEERSKFSSSNKENDPSLMSEPFVKLHDDEEAGHRFCIKENLKPSRIPRPHRRPELIKKNSPSLNKDIPLSLRSKRSRFSKIMVMEERSKFSSSNRENDPSLMSEPFVKLHDDEEAGHRFCIKENLKPSRLPRPHRRPELIKKNSPSLNKDIPLSLRSKRSRFSKIKVMEERSKFSSSNKENDPSLMSEPFVKLHDDEEAGHRFCIKENLKPSRIPRPHRRPELIKKNSPSLNKDIPLSLRSKRSRFSKIKVMEERSKFSSSNKENDPSLMSEPFVKLHDDEEAGHRFCIKENLKPSRLPRPHTRPELIKKNSPSLNKDIPLSLRSKRSRFSKIMVMEERSKFSSSNRENDPSLMSEPFVKLHDDEEAGHRFCIKENLKPSRLPRPHRRPELIKKNSPSLNKDIPLSLRSKRSRFSKIKVMEERSKFSSSNKENDPSLMSEPFVKLHDDEEAGHRFCIKENLKPSRLPRPHRRPLSSTETTATSGAYPVKPWRNSPWINHHSPLLNTNSPELIKNNSPSLNKDIPLSLRSKRSRFSKIKVMEERSKFKSSNKENDPSLMNEPFVKLHDDEEAGHRFCIKENLKPSRLPRPHRRPLSSTETTATSGAYPVKPWRNS